MYETKYTCFCICTFSRWHMKHSQPIKEIHVASGLLQRFHAPCWGHVLSQIKENWKQEQPGLHLCIQVLSKSQGHLLHACPVCTAELLSACSESQWLPGKRWSSGSFHQGMPYSTFSRPGKCSIFLRCIKSMRSLYTRRGISTFFLHNTVFLLIKSLASFSTFCRLPVEEVHFYAWMLQ